MNVEARTVEALAEGQPGRKAASVLAQAARPNDELIRKVHQNPPQPVDTSQIVSDQLKSLVRTDLAERHDALVDGGPPCVGGGELRGDLMREIDQLKKQLDDLNERIGGLTADLQIMRAANVTPLDRGRNVA